jgi:hypothetical protein
MSPRSTIYQLCRTHKLVVSWRLPTITFEQVLLAYDPTIDLEAIKTDARALSRDIITSMLELAKELNIKVARKMTGSVIRAIKEHLKNTEQPIPAVLRKPIRTREAANVVRTTLVPAVDAAPVAVAAVDATPVAPATVAAVDATPVVPVAVVAPVATRVKIRKDENTNPPQRRGEDEDGHFVDHYTEISRDGLSYNIFERDMIFGCYITHEQRNQYMVRITADADGETPEAIAKVLSQAIYLSRINRSTMTLAFGNRSGHVVDWRFFAPGLASGRKLSELLVEAISQSTSRPCYTVDDGTSSIVCYATGRIFADEITGMAMRGDFDYLAYPPPTPIEDEFLSIRKSLGYFAEALARSGYPVEVYGEAAGIETLSACQAFITENGLKATFVKDKPTAASYQTVVENKGKLMPVVLESDIAIEWGTRLFTIRRGHAIAVEQSRKHHAILDGFYVIGYDERFMVKAV